MVSLKMVYITNFLSATGFSLVATSIWPYLLQAKGGSSVKAIHELLGVVSGAFSIGQFFGKCQS
jgi:hypothetical protein